MPRLGRRRRAPRAVAGATVAPVLASISPDLGDTYGGAPVTLTGTSMGDVTAVTFGGTSATSVVAVNATTVTCIAPAKAAGTYDVIATNPTGNSNTLAAAYEAWHPTTDYAAARSYQADREVTSASSATRQRAGVQSSALPTAYSTIAAAQVPLDGQGFVELASGRFLIAGGAPAGHASEVVNTIWYSDDRGVTWAVLLANAAGSSTRPAPAHTFGFFTLTVSAVEYVYWLGGDPFTPTGDVFRSSDGGTTWARISTTCPTSGLALYMFGTIGTDIYVIGGQDDIEDVGVASKPTHKSTDYGATWSTLGAGYDCPATVYGAQLGRLPEKDGELWIAGSAIYDSISNDFSNAVHSFDGTTWTVVLANGHAQFPKSRYHSVVVDANGRLWRYNGTTWDGATLTADTASAHYSDDGATWTAAAFTLPWGNTHAQAALASTDGIYVTEGFQSSEVYVIREHTGALVSAWADQGSAGLDLSQTVDAKKPILDTGAFASRPGLVLTRAQYMTLAAPDVGLAGGHFEVFFVGKFLDGDASAAQGPNPPITVVGAVNGSSWNNCGFDAGLLCYEEYSAGYNTHVLGATAWHDDRVRLYGFRHETGSIKAYCGTTQQGATVTTSTFDTTYTGWDAVGAGYLEDDSPAFVLGAVVVLTESAASSGTFMTKLNTWAKKWGAVST